MITSDKEVFAERLKENDSRKRGRPKAQYKCEVSGKVCPFNDYFWETDGAEDDARYSCPIQAYQKKKENYINAKGRYVITSDHCRHLLERNEGKSGGEKTLNQYKVYLENSETTIVEAEDFEIKLPENEGQRRLVFTSGNSNVAVFNWSKIVGFVKL